jgi:MFS family permease
MLTAVLPLYFMLELRMTPLQFGLIDGIYQATSALVRVASGVVADGRSRYKAVATFGYGLSAVCKLGLALVGSGWGALTGLLMLDRLGKGIRTAPRDSLITLSSDRAHLGEAFGVHRALDTIGAFLGPLVAFGILTAAPGAYDAVFVVSFCVAIIGLAVIGLFVENRPRLQGDSRVSRASSQPLAGVFLNRRFRSLMVAGAVLGLLTASDALIYLLLHRRGALQASLFPLLFVGTAGVYLVLAVPFGRLADRVGRHRLFLAGHVLILGIYGLLLNETLSILEVMVCVGLLGAYYAATDGVLSALGSAVLEPAHLTTGLAVVATASAIARLCAAALFGALWSWWDAGGALIAFLVALSAAIFIGAVLLRVSRPWSEAGLE